MLPSRINKTPRLRELTPTKELARPSRPSIQLIAFVIPVIQMIVRKKTYESIYLYKFNI